MSKIFFLLLISLSVIASSKETYLRGLFLSKESAQKKWGIEKFDPEKFESAPYSKKAAMAVDALKTQGFQGKDPASVRKALGTPTGYLFNDTVLAYQIQPYTEQIKESWQLVFLPDADGKKIEEVRIHKKCCYETGVEK